MQRPEHPADPPDSRISASNDPPWCAETGSGSATDPAVWVGEIIEQLESGPDECRLALDGLNVVDFRVRLAIIAALGAYRERPAVRTLLRLLAKRSDPDLRSAAQRALSDEADRTDEVIDLLDIERRQVPIIVLGGDGPASTVPALPDPTSLVKRSPDLASGINRSVVTAVDGDGRGTIILCLEHDARWRTAAFRCDLLRGIIDASDEIDHEPPSTPRLVANWIDRFGPSDGYVLDSPELAVGLLGGSLKLGGAKVPDQVKAILSALLGSRELPTRLPPFEPAGGRAIPNEEIPARADLILDACPSWLDRSPLTHELAREITLRDDRTLPDPVRDAGAFRFLFEHRLSRRLELYARMLLWMAWIWRVAGHPELVSSAHALAGQLADEQFAVPSHPFIVALTSRSLRAAQSARYEPNPPDSLETSV